MQTQSCRTVCTTTMFAAYTTTRREKLLLAGNLAPLSLAVVALMASLNLVRSVNLTFQIGRAVSAGSFALMLTLRVVTFTS